MDQNWFTPFFSLFTVLEYKGTLKTHEYIWFSWSQCSPIVTPRESNVFVSLTGPFWDVYVHPSRVHVLRR